LPLDPQVEQVLELIRSAGNPEYWQMTPGEAREWHARKARILDIAPQPVFAAEDRIVEGPRGTIPLRIYTPRRSDAPLPLLVWLHGGGHVVGSLDTYDALCRMFAIHADCIVVAVDYRLAPEHKFPAGVDDSFAALQWVGAHAAELAGDRARIAVGGDSAGGNLAAVCAILARDAGSPALAMQLLVYPRTAADEESASHHAFADGFLLTRRTIQWFHAHYLGDDADRDDLRYAPLRCSDLSRLPPALVIVAEYDPLRDEGVAYARALERAGNRVALSEYAGMVHPFFSMGGAIDTAREAHAEAATALRAAFRRGHRTG
jgi:acetyl esterase